MERYAVIVDPYGGASDFVPAFRARGVQTVALLSDPEPLASYAARWHPEDFAWVHVYDGDLDELLRAVKVYDPICIVSRQRARGRVDRLARRGGDAGAGQRGRIRAISTGQVADGAGPGTCRRATDTADLHRPASRGRRLDPAQRPDWPAACVQAAQERWHRQRAHVWTRGRTGDRTSTRNSAMSTGSTSAPTACWCRSTRRARSLSSICTLWTAGMAWPTCAATSSTAGAAGSGSTMPPSTSRPTTLRSPCSSPTRSWPPTPSGSATDQRTPRSSSPSTAHDWSRSRPDCRVVA